MALDALSSWEREASHHVDSLRTVIDRRLQFDTEAKALYLWAALAERLGPVGLELHPEKTKVVYCQDTKRRKDYEHTSFDFLGYTFQGRLAKGRRGFFMNFSPAMSAQAKKAKGKQIRDWHLNRRSGTDLSGLAWAINAQVRGWINYYGAFYRSELYFIARRIDEHLVRWAVQKFKRLRGKPQLAWDRLREEQKRNSPALRPLAPSCSHSQPTCKSRMS